MELFRVAIEETVIDEFLIEADDRDEALDIAIQKYNVLARYSHVSKRLS